MSVKPCPLLASERVRFNRHVSLVTQLLSDGGFSHSAEVFIFRNHTIYPSLPPPSPSTSPRR